MLMVKILNVVFSRNLLFNIFHILIVGSYQLYRATLGALLVAIIGYIFSGESVNVCSCICVGYFSHNNSYDLACELIY